MRFYKTLPTIAVALLLHQGGNGPLEAVEVEGPFNYSEAVKEVRRVTGAHCRMVWTVPLEDMKLMQLDDGLELWVLDTEDGKSARKIGESDSYQRALLTADGQRVVWTDYPERVVKTINFDGTGLRTVCQGQMGDVWRDPATGEDWVYYRELIEGKPDREEHLYGSGKTWRCKLDDASVKELVWDKTAICHGSLFYLALTDDGKYGASAFPWASNGVAQFPNGAYQQWHFGCWSGLAPDNSGNFFSFDGDHNRLHMYDWNGINPREVRVDTMPENPDNKEVYFPRWTNHPDFLVLSYQNNAYLAKLNTDRTAIESYTRFAHEDVKGWLGYPDCWIDRGPDFKIADTANLQPLDTVVESSGDWPGSKEGIAFLWKNRPARNTVPGAGGVEAAINLDAAGQTRYGRYWQMKTWDGSFVPSEPGVAERIVAACKQGQGMTLEFTVEPSPARQDGTIFVLEGADGKPNLRVYQQLNRVNLQMPRTLVIEKGNKTGEAQDLFSLILSKSGPSHVVFSYAKGKLDVFMNGKYADTKFMGGFKGWEKDDFGAWADEVKLVFGQRLDGSDSWKGLLEGVAIYGRALTPPEAQQHYELYTKEMAGRTEAPVSKVEARLIARSTVPSGADMGIYSRGIIVNEYEILKVKEGDAPVGKVIVQQYAIADRKPLPMVAEWEIGKTYEMKISPVEDHPELEGERLFDETENFDAPVFLDVSAW